MTAVFKGVSYLLNVVTNVKDACQVRVMSTSHVRKVATMNHNLLGFIVFTFWTRKKNNKVRAMISTWRKNTSKK